VGELTFKEKLVVEMHLLRAQHKTRYVLATPLSSESGTLRQSRPDYGLDFKVKVLHFLTPFHLGSEAVPD